MKPIILALFILITGFAKAQNILTDSVYKKGIYRTFEEFKNNSPSIELKYTLKSHSSPMPMNDWTSYSIDMPKEESREIGDVYGFCNGYSIYIANSPAKIHKPAFEQVLYIGAYSFYQDQGDLNVNYTQNSYGNWDPTATPIPIYDKIINMETGEVTILTNKILKKLLSDNPKLLAEFKKDSKRHFRRVKYLQRYLEGRESQAK